MEFRILGPLEVTQGNGLVELGGPRQQTVLAMLLLEANRVVAVDRLIDAMWDEAPPATARAQVHICISTLRRQLIVNSQQGIESRRPGYMLKVDEETLDSHTFETFAVLGREAMQSEDLQAASTALRNGLALWRGQVLADVASRLVQQSAMQLNERRLLILEQCLSCELRMGLYHETASELAGLVEQYPLRERFRALMMAALYRAGRQAEALDSFRRARRTFIDELGIEPGRELQQIHKAILNGSPLPDHAAPPAAVTRPAAVPRQEPADVPQLLPATIPDFTGRATLVQQTAGYVTEPGTGENAQKAVPMAIIVGQGGTGKTTLAVHVAHQVAAQFPDGQLFARLRMGDLPANPGDILERFLRALGVTSSLLPAGIEERAEMYRNLLARRRVLIVLDDVQSEQQISFLVPGSPRCSVIMTSRKRLTEISGVRRAELGDFSHRSAVEFLTRIVGTERIQDSLEPLTALCGLCGYLPLALRIVGARLAARPHWSVIDLYDRLVDESRRLDELSHGGLGMRASILLTYQNLSAEAQRLFRRLALCEAPTFGSWIGSPLLQTDLRTAQDLMDELAEAYLVDAEPGPVGVRYRFHDIVRLFARERLAAEETAQDRHVALEQHVAALLYLAGEAHRREYSGDFTLSRSGASRWALPDHLVNRLLDNPLAWYENERVSIVCAIRQAAASGLTEHAWDLALNTVTLFEAHTHFTDWRETHETALTAACRAGDIKGEAVMRYSLGSLYMFKQQTELAVRQFTQAHNLFTKLDDRHGAALVLRNLAYLDRMNGNLELALSRWEEALGSFQVLGDRITEAHVLHNMAQVHLDFGNTTMAGRLLDRAEGICADLGNRRVGAQVLHRIGELHMLCGQLDLAANAYRRVLVTARESDDQVGECYALLGLGLVQLGRGEVTAAMTLADAQQRADATGDQIAQSRVLLARARAALTLGHLDEAADYAELALAIFTRLKVAVHRAEALLVRGRVYAANNQPQAALHAWQASSAILSTLKLTGRGLLSQELARVMAAHSSISDAQ